MLASSLVGPFKFEIIDVPKPEIKAGTALVRAEIATICGSDLHFYEDGTLDGRFPSVPGFPGHEVVGFIEDSDCEEFKIGDRVLVVPGIPPNAFVEWIVLPPDKLVKLPDGPSLEELVVGQQLGTVIHATRRWPNIIGWDAVVLGQGGGGLLFDIMLKNLGARTIIGIDVVPHRLEAARKVGATHVIDASKEDPVKVVGEITDGRLGDIVVEAVGRPETVNLVPDLIHLEGFISLFGIPKSDDTWRFAYGKFFRKYATTISTSNTQNEPGLPSFKQAMSMIASGHVDTKPLISHRLPFASLSRAFELGHKRADGALKVVLEFHPCKPIYSPLEPGRPETGHRR